MIRKTFFDWHIFAFFTLTVLAAFKACLVAFTVFFEAVGLLAVAAFDMFVVFDLLAERVGVSIHQGQDGIVPLFAVDL